MTIVASYVSKKFAAHNAFIAFRFDSVVRHVVLKETAVIALLVIYEALVR